MAKPKKWFWVWEADRVTGRKIGKVAKKWAVSDKQARNFYRHEFYEGEPFESLDNLIVASEVGSGINPVLDPPRESEAVEKVGVAKTLMSVRPKPVQEELSLGIESSVADFFDPPVRTPRRRKR